MLPKTIQTDWKTKMAKQTTIERKKDLIFGAIEGLATDFLYYDRKEDANLPVGEIDDLVHKGIVTVDEMVEAFAQAIGEGLISE